MRRLLSFAVIVAVFSWGDAFSKYGRTCKDIGCPSNQECVMQHDPCTFYSRRNQCGKYPTCRKVSNAAATCASYVCPPTMSCRMDQGVPKCYASSGKNNKPEHSDAPAYPQKANQNPIYPQYPNYPNPAVYPRNPAVAGYGQTTSRPNVYQPGQRTSGAGYQGGVIGSGYPGQGGHSRHNSRYPTHGYPTPGYPNQGYPNQGYPNQGYPNQGYPNQGYPQQTHHNGHYPTQWNNGYSGQTYPRQGGHSNSGQGGYPSNEHQRYNQRQGQDDSSSILNAVTSFLKTNLNL